MIESDEGGNAQPTGENTATVEDAPIEPTTGLVDEDEFELTEQWDNSSSASTSITSSIYRHSYENGRRFHSYKYGRYPLLNDDIEQNRENIKHAMMLEVTDGRLYYAPLSPYAQKIIDIGTGTGIWAIEGMLASLESEMCQ